MVNKKLKEAFNDTKESWKTLGKWIYLVLKWTWTGLYNVLNLWYRWAEAGDKALAKQINKKKHGPVIKFLSDKILRTIWALWIAWWLVFWWNALKENADEFFNDEWFEEKIEAIWDDPKVFWVDVSRYNAEWRVDIFTAWSNERDNSTKEDVRRPSFVYILWRKEKGLDEKAKWNYENVKAHKEQLSDGKMLAVGAYSYFNKSQAWITEDGLNKQVDEFIKIWKLINQEWDWLVDLTPMLDFEYSANEKVERSTSTLWKKHKAAVLKWLKLFEKKTWVTPGIYANASTYKDFFYWDPAFSKYPAWIAYYNWEAVDQDKWTVTYQGKQMEAHIIQFSEEIKKSWFWTHRWTIDWNTSTQWKFWKLVQDNDDVPKKQ